MANSIFDSFYDIVYKNKDFPESFIEAAGISLISQTLGQYYCIPDTPSFNFRPNLNLVLSSSPGITRRSGVIKAVDVVKEKCYKTLFKDDENQALSEIRAHLLQSGSWEGMLDDMIPLQQNNVHGFAITNDECGTSIFKQITNKNSAYGAHLDYFFTQAYDGKAQHPSLSKRGKNKVDRYLREGYYLNFFGAMQRPDKYISMDLVDTGCLRRFLIFNVLGENHTRYIPPLGQKTSAFKEELEALGVEIAGMINKHMVDDKDCKFGCPITMDQKTQDIINKKDKEIHVYACDNDTDPVALTQQNGWEFYIKFAACLALAEGRRTIDYDRHTAKAMKIVDGAFDSIRPFLQHLEIPDKKKDYERNLSRIEKYYKRGLGKRDIQQFMGGYGVHAEELTKMFWVLAQESRIPKEWVAQ